MKPLATRVVLRNVRLAYADSLIVPKAYEAGQQEKYSCTILLPPGHPGVEQIEAAVGAAATGRWGRDKSEWPRPLKGITRDPIIKDVAHYPKIGIREAGWSFVRASSLEQPGIVDANLVELTKLDLRREVYSGRRATVSIYAFVYDRPTGAGVSLGLGNVQVLEHDTRLGAPRLSPGEEFDTAELPGPHNDDGLDPLPRRSTRQR
jgi:hypothetical protein